MKLCRRNTTLFDYEPFLGLVNDLDEHGRHTGEPTPAYGAAHTFRGTISAPSGATVQALDGLEGRYTNTLIMASPDTGIKENGRITWKDNHYAVVAVRPSLNFTVIALRLMRTEDGIDVIDPEVI